MMGLAALNPSFDVADGADDDRQEAAARSG
jgi:hypothetical protein